MATIRRRRPSLNFTDMGILIGAKLKALDGGEAAIVATARTIIFRGAETSLTAATRLTMGVTNNPMPCPHWTYNGKNLGEIYDETYGRAR